MTFLLDVNALIALGIRNHEFHARVTAWIRSQNFPPLATCSITELGFVRLLAQARTYGFDVPIALSLLLDLKQRSGFLPIFLADGNDISQLPDFVKTPKQITDGHLLRLAQVHGAVLATLDRSIPGAYVIPRNS